MKYLGYSTEDFLADESFINYLNNSNETDVALWKKVLFTYPQIFPKTEEARELYLQLSLKRSDEERFSQLQRLKLRLPKEVEIGEEENKGRSKAGIKVWFAIAASLLIFLGIYLIAPKFSSSDQLIAYTADLDNYTILAETSLGERKTVELPDGSSVILNGLSVLRISKSYNIDNRVLKLNGEAFFDVAKDKNKPFIVIANKSITTALGTSFKIKNYPKEQETSVMLTTGKVSVQEVENDKIVGENLLLPGEQVELFDYKKSVKSDFDLLSVANWKEKNLHFSMANINEIKQKLYDMYGVSVIAENIPKSNNQVFTGSFSGDTLLDVLDAISFVNHFDYQIKENNVYITYHQ